MNINTKQSLLKYAKTLIYVETLEDIFPFNRNGSFFGSIADVFWQKKLHRDQRQHLTLTMTKHERYWERLSSKILYPL